MKTNTWALILFVCALLWGCVQGSLDLPTVYQNNTFTTGAYQDREILLLGTYEGGPAFKYEYAIRNRSQAPLEQGSKVLIEFYADSALTYNSVQLSRYLLLPAEIPSDNTSPFYGLSTPIEVSRKPGRILAALVSEGQSINHQGVYVGTVKRDSATSITEGFVKGYVLSNGKVQLLLSLTSPNGKDIFEALQARTLSPTNLNGTLAGKTFKNRNTIWADDDTIATGTIVTNLFLQTGKGSDTVNYTIALNPLQAR